MLVHLQFSNKTAQNFNSLKVDASGVSDVLEWYGSFYAGDEYTVLLNGRPVSLDVNGCREYETIEMEDSE